MNFDQLKNDFSWIGTEKEVLKFWDDNKIFQKSVDLAEGRERFVFFEGPPTANGRPGIHHIIARTIKDLVCRYKTMRGYRVDRKGGWDTHGLPVEVEVEKKLGLDSKQKINEFGIARFNEECKKSVFTYKKEWDEITRRIGYWLDLEHPYITLENYYIETVWHLLADFHNRGLIYQGHKTVPFCARCETTLSSHEVAQGYEEIEDPSVYVRMKAEDGDYSYLVWTTTPWTLPSNAAICFHPEETYVRVQFKGEEFVLAEALANQVLGDEFKVISRSKGSTFAGKRYIPLFDTFKEHSEDAFYAITADFVTMEDGTGIVHIAPGFGADDYEMGKKYSLPVLQAIYDNGHFKEDSGWLAGKYIKAADPEIVADLKKRGLLFKSEKYTHSYPFCWRCDSPLIYIARKSWYIRTTDFKDQLLENNRKINWYPPEIGSGRFGEWLENNVDWAISRERFWGTPLPIWICEKCGTQKAIGSVADLKKYGKDVPDDLDLHKPFIDEITLTCEECGGNMKRVAEVIDVWFDSGAMPFAQWHYPFENKERFEQLYPAEFISEAVDQTRGWFYSLLAIATMYKGDSSFKNCLVMEFVVDRDGKKMSKHIGNVVDPFLMVDKFGADALRWYMISTSHPWISLKFDEEGVAITQRKFFDTMKNCYSFWALYANIDDVAAVAAKTGKSVGDYLREQAGEAGVTDRWIWSRYNSTVARVTASLDSYNVTQAARLIQNFVIDDLSNWYIRLNRSRFYGSGNDPDKMLVYSRLYDVLSGVCGLVAPIAPFFADFVYRQLLAENPSGLPESIHLTAFPASHPNVIDETLEEDMAYVQKIVSLALAARKRKNLKVRQPLSRIAIHSQRKELAGDSMAEIIRRELNIKAVEFVDDTANFIRYTARPNFSALGPKYGKDMGHLTKLIQDFSSAEVEDFLSDGQIGVQFDGRRITLTEDDLEVVRIESEGYAVESEGDVTVALSTELSEDLVDEGFARELVNKIQNMRKTADFNVTDRIAVTLHAEEPLSGAAERFENYIRSETLADSLRRERLSIADDSATEWSINGEKAKISIRRV